MSTYGFVLNMYVDRFFFSSFASLFLSEAHYFYMPQLSAYKSSFLSDRPKKRKQSINLSKTVIWTITDCFSKLFFLFFFYKTFLDIKKNLLKSLLLMRFFTSLYYSSSYFFFLFLSRNFGKPLTFCIILMGFFFFFLL